MDAVEDIKSRLNIEDVVSEYVQLKRSGRNFKGLSPFTNEKTPSFMVSPEKQIWHDFSSGKGGNMFSFVMEMEGLDFKGALELLARKAGVDLTQYQTGHSGETTRLKERLYAANEQAAKFYQVHFSKNQTALEYVFKKRKFNKETALKFRLGYAPNNGTALMDYLKKQGFSEQDLQKAGLVSRRYRPADMFRGRLMIPLQDSQGRVIGFTARLLDDEPNAPKYINTPQTLLYDKGRHVYGLHLAKEAIRKDKFAVVVEGNLDVIASHQVGVNQVVATAGTAMTEMHLKELSRFTGDIRLCFDEDQAGQNATERAIPIASKVGVSLSIIVIPEGKDPDELIQKNPKLWQTALGKQQYAFDWLIDHYRKQLDLDSAPGKRQFSDVVLGVVKQIQDSVEQDHYLQRIAELLGVSAEALYSKLRQSAQPRNTLKRPKTTQAVMDKDAEELKKTEDHLLALTLLRPGLRNYLVPLTADMLQGSDAKELFKFLLGHPDFDGKSAAVSELKQIADYVKILSVIYETLYQDVEELELQYEAAHLKKRLIGLYVKRQKTAIVSRLQEADETEAQKLLQKVQQLNSLLK
jgi:DNA primase